MSNAWCIRTMFGPWSCCQVGVFWGWRFQQCASLPHGCIPVETDGVRWWLVDSGHLLGWNGRPTGVLTTRQMLGSPESSVPSIFPLVELGWSTKYILCGQLGQLHGEDSKRLWSRLEATTNVAVSRVCRWKIEMDGLRWRSWGYNDGVLIVREWGYSDKLGTDGSPQAVSWRR